MPGPGFMSRGLFILALLSLTSCMTIGGRPYHADFYEITYQSLALIDAGQTYQIGRNPKCYQESNSLLGPSPGAGRIIPYFALVGTLHFLFSAWLDREVDSTDDDGWRVARFLWRAGTLGYEGWSVTHNFKRGLTPFSSSLDVVRDGCLGVFP